MAGNARRTSLRAVARHAGVSVSTVSRFVNGQLALVPDTEARVRSAMTALGYVHAARPAARGSHGTVIGLVVPSIASMYFGRIAERIVAAADADGIAVLTASTRSHPRKERDALDLLLGRGVAGIIYAGSHPTNTALGRVLDAGIPVVVIDEAIDTDAAVDTVLVDDYAGAYQATAHLLSAGHRRIGLLTGPNGLRSVRERRRGYRDALRRAGIEPDGGHILSGPFSEEFGAAALSRLSGTPASPTAIFAASDAIALGALRAASALGLAIPADLSIVGFDDVPAAGYVSPRLTTVRTPVERMAAAAVTTLVERMTKPSTHARSTVIPVALVTGDSVAPPLA